MNDLDHLLTQTSRTFALSIPQLPEPTRTEVTLAYLLFRIADTFEDAAAWSRVRRLEALERFAAVVAAPAAEAPALAADLAASLSEGRAPDLPSAHEGYLKLLAAMPFVVTRFGALSAAARRIVGEHTLRTTRGMARFVERTDGDGRLALADEDDLADYCYVVAGIVGEMLTELFLLGRPALAADAAYLRRRAAPFGEALQLVNILKDAAADAAEGRQFLPAGVAPEAVFRRARAGLDAATEYVVRLQLRRADGVERGLVAFCALPVRLARATLDRVEAEGAGAKLTRPEVYRIVAELERDLDAGAPAAAAAGAPSTESQIGTV